MNDIDRLCEGLPRRDFASALRREYPFVVKNPKLFALAIIERRNANFNQISKTRLLFGPQRYSVVAPNYTQHSQQVFKLIFKENRNSMEGRWVHFAFKSYFKTAADAVLLRMLLENE